MAANAVEGIRIVVFGDSITRGDNVEPAERFTSIAERELSDALGRPVRVINSGVNADTTALAVKRLRPDVFDHAPDYSVIMFGVNDAGFFRPETPETPAETPRVSLADFRQYLRTMPRQILDKGIRPILATPVPMTKYYWLVDYPPYVENGLNYLVDEYAQAVRDTAVEKAIPLIDVHAEFNATQEAEEFVPDGIHPDARGHRLIADVYVRELKRIL